MTPTTRHSTIRVFNLGGTLVRVPEAWDYVKVEDRQYMRRRRENGRHSYWVRTDGQIVGGPGRVMQREVDEG